MLTWADRTMRRAAGSLWWAVRLLMPAQGAATFTSTYSYFRWADDIVDAPDRDPAAVQRFVQRQRALVESLLAGAEAELRGPAEAALASAIHSRPGCPRIATSIRLMWEALAFDAARDAAAITTADLERQIQRVGDAYTEALLACLDVERVPEGIWTLARAATAVHHLRDLVLDTSLGYNNLPLAEAQRFDVPARPAELSEVAPYIRHRARDIRALFAVGRAALDGLPLRSRLLFGGLAFKYQRQLSGLLAPLPAREALLSAAPAYGAGA